MEINNKNTLNDITLSVLLDALKDNIFHNLNCIKVGQVESFDALTQTAVIQLKIQGTKDLDYAPLVDCPCLCLSGSLGGVDIPISKGDTCIVLFNDRSIDEWFTTNQNQVPLIYRTHDFSDAFALIGIRSMQNLISNYLVNATKVWYNENSLIISDASADLTAPVVNTIASLTNLGVGGNRIARLGDEVQVTVPGHGVCTGTITSAGVNTSI